MTDFAVLEADPAAHQHRGTRRARSQGAAHSDAEIAPTLANGFNAAAPMSRPTACLVGRHGDKQAPAPVGGEPTQQQRQHQPLELHRRDVADCAREPALAGAELRRTHKQHQMAPHQPYSRTMRAGGTPAK